MYMHNASSNARRPNATYILLTRVVGNANFSVRVEDNPNFSVFRYQHVGIPNAKYRVGGIVQRKPPTREVLRCSGI